MAKAVEVLRKSADYTGWSLPEMTEGEEIYRNPWGDDFRFRQKATGNLGALNLERAEFIDALQTFMEGELWDDAAFIAERILTADELKAYVDKQAPPTEAAPVEDTDMDERRDLPSSLRYLLGRRLVREDRYTEARQYMKPPCDKILDNYVQALKDGANEKLPKAKRARAWFHAAWLARYDGMELMGTEVAPDGFTSRGSFPSTDLVSLRESGSYKEDRLVDGEWNQVEVPVFPKPSKEEIRRLKQHRVSPEMRYHYRVIGAALAMRATALLPDNTEELADVITQAGHWVTNQWTDRKIADRYYSVLEKRCSDTKIAVASLERGAFVGGQVGPWSNEEEATRNARAD